MPIKIIDWKKAMTLFFAGRAQVVEVHKARRIRGVSRTYELPKVLKLITRFVSQPKVKFNRANIYHRDKFTCQYCANRFKPFELTFDHVIPRSRGGATSWKNIVTCCKSCNNQKANKTPEEWGVRLIKIPKEPKWLFYFHTRLNNSERKMFEFWIAS